MTVGAVIATGGGRGGHGRRAQIADASEGISTGELRGSTAGASGETAGRARSSERWERFIIGMKRPTPGGAKAPHLDEEASEAKAEASVPRGKRATPTKCSRFSGPADRKARAIGRWCAWSRFGEPCRREVLARAASKASRRSRRKPFRGHPLRTAKAAAGAQLPARSGLASRDAERRRQAAYPRKPDGEGSNRAAGADVPVTTGVRGGLPAAGNGNRAGKSGHQAGEAIRAAPGEGQSAGAIQWELIFVRKIGLQAWRDSIAWQLGKAVIFSRRLIHPSRAACPSTGSFSVALAWARLKMAARVNSRQRSVTSSHLPSGPSRRCSSMHKL